jgi:hypothetical protein
MFQKTVILIRESQNWGSNRVLVWKTQKLRGEKFIWQGMEQFCDISPSTQAKNWNLEQHAYLSPPSDLGQKLSVFLESITLLNSKLSIRWGDIKLPSIYLETAIKGCLLLSTARFASIHINILLNLKFVLQTCNFIVLNVC